MNKWEEVEYREGKEHKALAKSFEFKNFSDALEFVNKVGELAEKANHHPDINLSWGYVRVSLTTHSEHAITEKDRELAVKIDKITEKN